MAKISGFPYIKFITGESMVGYGEMAKCNLIRKVFDDAYKSPCSAIVLDDIERLVEYVHLGPRFSNAVLQTLLVMIKKQPPKGKKLLIIGTTSSLEVLESLELTTVFNVTLHIPALQKLLDEVSNVVTLMNVKFATQKDKQEVLELLPKYIGVKTLMLVCEMAQALAGETGGLPRKNDFAQALKSCGCSLDMYSQ
jgi:vesicle-fusing ATPase